MPATTSSTSCITLTTFREQIIFTGHIKLQPYKQKIKLFFFLIQQLYLKATTLQSWNDTLLYIQYKLISKKTSIFLDFRFHVWYTFSIPLFFPLTITKAYIPTWASAIVITFIQNVYSETKVTGQQKWRWHDLKSGYFSILHSVRFKVK